MPRYPRNYTNTSFFHVMTQGINKSFIFNTSDDINYYISLLYKLINDYNINIIAYCIMNNHAHILLQTKSIEHLSKFMQRVDTSYSRFYNKKYSHVGFVFRNRFRSEGIFTEEQLYNCINYIYNNPVKARICATPDKYPFSNYRKIDKILDNTFSFIDIEEDKDIVIKDVVQQFLSNNNIDVCILKKDNQKLKELLVILIDIHKFSFRRIASELHINRIKLSKIYSQNF